MPQMPHHPHPGTPKIYRRYIILHMKFTNSARVTKLDIFTREATNQTAQVGREYNCSDETAAIIVLCARVADLTSTIAMIADEARLEDEDY